MGLESAWPGLQNVAASFLVEFDVRQGPQQGTETTGTISLAGASRPTGLALGGDTCVGDRSRLKSLLEAVCREIIIHKLCRISAGEMADAIQTAGFRPQRTLIWMAATS